MKSEAKVFRGLAARQNFLNLDCPGLQFSSESCSREMATPKIGPWRKLKKVARYLVRKRVIWRYDWREEMERAFVVTDSDWGGNCKDRRSASGGVFMLGGHCIKTRSATQRAYALSSAETELYGMVEGATRSKGLVSLARELGFGGLSLSFELGTDSSAAKSFVNRRGLGKMRHLQVHDLWLQKEVRQGGIVIHEVHLMTKILNVKEVEERLEGMNLKIEKYLEEFNILRLLLERERHAASFAASIGGVYIHPSSAQVLLLSHTDLPLGVLAPCENKSA